MRAYWTLTRRDLAGYFLSLTGYVVIAATTFLVGLSFVDLLKALKQEPTAMPVTELFYVTWYFWLILLLVTPVITMRLFALEKFSGTFETLMTTPVSDLQVVLAKFSAAMLFYLLLWLPLAGCLWIACRYSNSPVSFVPALLGIGLRLGLILVLMLAVIVMVNYLSGEHYWRWRCTTRAKAELSPRTVSLLKTITNEVKVIIYYDRDEPSYRDVADLLYEYKAIN